MGVVAILEQVRDICSTESEAFVDLFLDVFSVHIGYMTEDDQLVITHGHLSSDLCVRLPADGAPDINSQDLDLMIDNDMMEEF